MSRSPRHLLAKTPRDWDCPERRATLVGHTDDAIRTASAVVDANGAAALSTLGLTMYSPTELRVALVRAAALHDLGKANSQFLRMLRHPASTKQALRHEWISAWLPLAGPFIGDWLLPSNEVVRFAILAAVAGHHLKFASLESLQPSPSEDLNVTVFTDHPDFHDTLELIAEHLNLDSPPLLPPMRIDLTSRPLDELRRWAIRSNGFYKRLTEQDRRFVALVKSLLVSVDVAASAVPRFERAPNEWARDVLNRVCSADVLASIAQKRLGKHSPRPFQDSVAESVHRVTFVNAGCGSGKTVAAYMWAARHAAGRKVHVCYPTTGTTTEGFRDYIIEADLTDDAQLMHSRSEVDLETILETPDLPDRRDSEERIRALLGWDPPITISTVDPILGLMQNYRSGLFRAAPILNGAFVFDEIHQYDDRMFDALLDFLDAFTGAPILLMTASLPEARLKVLSDRLSKRGETLGIVHGTEELETLPRYVFREVVDEPPWDEVIATVSNGGKVLWVSNTVDRCVTFANDAVRRGLPPTCVYPYHSRYRYRDRVRRHSDVIHAFKEDSGTGILAVTTQVCEVSLDLSADLLVTDVAPVPGLIQRMGRLNRRASPETPGTPKPVVFLNPTHPLPYTSESLESAHRWIDALIGDAQSQRDLSRAFESLPESPRTSAPAASAWLEGGAFSPMGSLRDGGITAPFVREEDAVDCIQNGKVTMTEVVRNEIPMTVKGSTFLSWRRLGYAYVAPKGSIYYSERWGATWVNRDAT
ncbi:MAG: CRISPR-associated helicase Cas3' [Candidatus Poribacteria bacterium]|nr:CRISPR-associated helicase Cas3' [Candidatus Poribacteria bacterium]